MYPDLKANTGCQTCQVPKLSEAEKVREKVDRSPQSTLITHTLRWYIESRVRGTARHPGSWQTNQKDTMTPANDIQEIDFCQEFEATLHQKMR